MMARGSAKVRAGRNGAQREAATAEGARVTPAGPSLSRVTYYLELANADEATGLFKARCGDFVRAAQLFARAQRQLAEAEIVLHALARGAGRRET